MLPLHQTSTVSYLATNAFLVQLKFSKKKGRSRPRPFEIMNDERLT